MTAGPLDPRAHLDPLELAELICAQLDPLLTRHGFAPGQIGVGSTVGVVFCASFTDFRERFPRLGGEAAAIGELPAQTGAARLRDVLERLLTRHAAN